MEGALNGLRVIEISEFVAGAYAGKIMADLGADVIKVENPGFGDKTRYYSPYYRGKINSDGSVLFHYLNTNKRSVTIDVIQETGKKLFESLLSTADVLLTDYHPNDIDNLGISYNKLEKDNPQLIFTAVTPFGLMGPHSQLKAFDINIFHAGGEGYLLPSGLTWEMFPEREPIKVGGHTSEYISAVTAAVGTLAAVFNRGITNQGQMVDVSKQDAQLALNHLVVNRYIDGTLERRENRSFTHGGVMKCADGYVEILPLEQHQWEKLVKVMDNPEWAKDERFQNIMGRAKNGAEVNRLIRAWSIRQKAEDVYRKCQEQGCPAGVYYSAKEVYESEQLIARGFFKELEHQVTGTIRYPSWPYQFSETPAAFQRPAPRLGEHNKEVLGQELGLEDNQLNKLRHSHVI
jgi:CoA:oxalate CoA-transferase